MEFLLIPGVPPGGGKWVDWDGDGYRCVGDVPFRHAHACCKHDKHGCLHGGGHLQFLYMYTCPCVHVHACTCMCTCVPTLPCPQIPLPPTCPLPRAVGSPKHQNSISLKLIEIFRFCLKILYL